MRQYYHGIDLLRILACVMVLLTHSCECYYISNFYAGGGFENLDIPTWQAEALWAGIFDSLSHCCVPIFVMISGFLLLPMKPGMSMGDFSRLSYGIYLCHIIFLTWLYEEIFLPLALPTAISIIAICLCTVITSYLVIKAISYLPKSKWIVGA